jgi:hypothetical protein
MTRIESLLLDPSSDASLDELKGELNELARLRQGSRVAFCKRLAVVYMIIVGQRPRQGRKANGDAAKFVKWCTTNIQSATGKRYTRGTLLSYISVGFSANPEKLIVDSARKAKRRDEKMRKLGSGLSKAIDNGTKVVPITKLRDQSNLTGNIATQVNAMMRSWEQADPQARSQFIYMVTGIRIASAASA